MLFRSATSNFSPWIYALYIAFALKLSTSPKIQIFGTIVTQAAKAYNSTFIREKNDGQQLDCAIVAASRVFDQEAEDIFGPGYFSFQVHVKQRIVLESSNQIYLEVVQSLIETGFGR